MSNDYFNTNNVNNYWAQQERDIAHSSRLNEVAARRELDAQKFANNSNVDLILQLRNKTNAASQKSNQLEEDNAKLASEKQFFENLLSLPMKQIAEKSSHFKETYEAQQLALAKWILSQKAYAETALQIGIESGKTTEEVQKIYNENIVSVLANVTKHGNDAIFNPVLKENISKIIKR